VASEVSCGSNSRVATANDSIGDVKQCRSLTVTSADLSGVASAGSGALLEWDESARSVCDGRTTSTRLAVLGRGPGCVFTLACGDTDVVGHAARVVLVRSLEHEVRLSGGRITTKTDGAVFLSQSRRVKEGVVSSIVDLEQPGVATQLGRVSRTRFVALTIGNGRVWVERGTTGTGPVVARKTSRSVEEPLLETLRLASVPSERSVIVGCTPAESSVVSSAGELSPTYRFSPCGNERLVVCCREEWAVDTGEGADVERFVGSVARWFRSESPRSIASGKFGKDCPVGIALWFLDNSSLGTT